MQKIPIDVLLDAWYTVHGDRGFVFPQLVSLHPESLEVRMYRFLQDAIWQSVTHTGSKYITRHDYPPYQVTLQFTSKQPLGVTVQLRS